MGFVPNLPLSCLIHLRIHGQFWCFVCVGLGKQQQAVWARGRSRTGTPNAANRLCAWLHNIALDQLLGGVGVRLLPDLSSNLPAFVDFSAKITAEFLRTPKGIFTSPQEPSEDLALEEVEDAEVNEVNEVNVPEAAMASAW